MFQDKNQIFQMAGSDSELVNSLSKGAQEIFQKMADRKAREAMAGSHREGLMVIAPKPFDNAAGRIDAEGRVFDSADQYIIQIDLASGKIMLNINNTEIGTFLPNCQYSEYRLIELIRQNDTRKNPGWYAGGAMPAAGGNSAHWGKESESMGNSPIWAEVAATTSTKDDNNSWW